MIFSSSLSRINYRSLRSNRASIRNILYVGGKTKKVGQQLYLLRSRDYESLINGIVSKTDRNNNPSSATSDSIHYASQKQRIKSQNLYFAKRTLPSLLHERINGYIHLSLPTRKLIHPVTINLSPLYTPSGDIHTLSP